VGQGFGPAAGLLPGARNRLSICMHSNLSSGLPELVTSSNRILRADTMQPVLLRGINRSGLEYSPPSDSGFLDGAQFTLEEMRQIVIGWRANLIRLPFNQEWALHGAMPGVTAHTAEEYLTALDQAISWAAGLGAYTILDLQWLDTETAYGSTADQNGVLRPNHVPPTPNAESITLWQTLAERYRDEPAVLFDLLNEPHDLLADDDHPILEIVSNGEVAPSASRFVGPDEWLPWATRLISEIRRIRPTGIILVGGIDWAFDLRGIVVDAPNIVYSTHIYSNRAPADWWKAFGAADEVPILIGEWGGSDSDLDFGRNLANTMRRLGLGWTAWSWVDYPQLVQQPRAPAYEPTAFGALVRNELLT
jgi:endoglucanase